MSLQVLRRPNVEKKTGLARSTIYHLMAVGTFPKPIELAGANSVSWLEAEVNAWMEARIKERDASAPPPMREPPAKRRRGRPRKVRAASEAAATTAV